MNNKTLFIAQLVCVLMLLQGCNTGQSHDEKQHSPSSKSGYTPAELFNSDWQFTKSDEVLSLEKARQLDAWQKVQLPHTPNIEPKIVNDQWQGDAWYRKIITYRPEWKGKKVILDFEGAMNESQVWLNGELVAQHRGGYLPFSVNLTSQLVEGDNTLMVRLDNRDNPITGPKPLEILDFNLFGGIYRNVWLRVENPIHISNAVAANKVASGGVFVTYPLISKERAQLAVKTHLYTPLQNKRVKVTHSLTRNGLAVASSAQAVTLDGAKDKTIEQILEVIEPDLWSPAKPDLYLLTTQVYVDNKLWDEDRTQIGLREFTFKNNQLYINGEKTFLRGVNRHQEYPYIGYALSDAAQYRDAEKIKAAGFDYVRLSHYPHSTAFMKAADELGLVLIDAILGWQYVSEDPEFQNHVVQTCRDMIRRDRNHASVLAWECSLNESWMEESLIDRFQAAVHEEYPSPTTYSAGWQSYGYDIYLQARQHRLQHYDTPTKPYNVSEYGDWEYYAMNAGLNQDSWGDLKQADRSSRQLLSDGETRLQQQADNIAEAHNDNFNTPAFADGYWVMFDYNRGYADDLEASGIMSIDRLPKFSYYFYQSQRSAVEQGGPLAGGYMVHIASHWQPESSLEFLVYSNADRVEVSVNGKAVAGERATAKYPNLQYPPFVFRVDRFEAGRLEAKAFANGKQVATHTVVTPRAPARIELALERSAMPIQTGVNDTVFVYAKVLDANNNNSRVNHLPVHFSLTGDAQLVSPDVVLTEDGIATALIRVGDDVNSIRISAKTDTLDPASLALGSQ